MAPGRPLAPRCPCEPGAEVEPALPLLDAVLPGWPGLPLLDAVLPGIP